MSVPFGSLGEAPLRFEQHFAFCKRCLEKLAVPERHDPEMRGKAVDRLGAHAVEPHAELEHIVVVFCAGIDYRHAFDDFAQRDSPPEVPYRNDIFFDGNFHLFAEPHDEFVYRIINHFLDQHVNAVVGVGTVAQPANIHSWP